MPNQYNISNLRGYITAKGYNSTKISWTF